MSDEMNGTEDLVLTERERKSIADNRKWAEAEKERQAQRGTCPECGKETTGYRAVEGQICSECDTKHKVAAKRVGVGLLLKIVGRVDVLGEIDSISANPEYYGDLGFTLVFKGKRYTFSLKAIDDQSV